MRKACILHLALAIWMAGMALPGQGQEQPVLVRDIATGPAYSPGRFESPLVRLRGKAWFAADDGFAGRELWASNGTPGGTRLIADLCPGRCSGNPWILTPSGGLLYFFAGNTTNGIESFWLWRSDGTAAGTFPLVDLEIGAFGSANPVSFLAPFQDGVVFIVHNRVRRGWSLWRSDGTRAGTREVEPLPGKYNSVQYPFDSDWARTLDDSGHHYFSWRGHLWVTDGTAPGTRRSSIPVQLCGGAARLGRLMIYAGQEEKTQDCELWLSDGTARGTRLLRDIRRDDSSYPSSFVAAGGLVYFTAYDGRHVQLWKTDGTSRGTVIVRALGIGRGLGKAMILGAAGSTVYFAANDGAHGIELWRTDGSRESTALVADLSPGAADTGFLGGGRSLGDRLIFAAWPSGESKSAIFRTEGTAASTVRLTGSRFSAGWVFAEIEGRVYFLAGSSAPDEKLGATDGTVEGTHVLDLAHPVPSSDPHELIAGPAGVVFLADGDESGIDAWHSAGRPEDTEPLADLVPGYDYSDQLWLAPGSGGAFYYTFDDQRFGWTDGQTVRDLLPPSSLHFPWSFVDLGDRTLFFATRQVSGTEPRPWIWSSDGTPDGTSPVAAASNTGEDSSFQFRAALVPDLGEVRYVGQRDTPSTRATLSATDGTAAGTRALVRIPIRQFQHLDRLVAAGRNVFVTFWSDDRASLWVSDGTEDGTQEIYTINRPWDLSIIYDLAATRKQAFFPGDDFEHGRELWVSDGIPEGTHRVADLAPGAESSTPSGLFAFGDRILFSADDGKHGRELWVSDGTAEGTRLLEIQPGPRGSYPQDFRVIDGRVVFAADDGIHGLEPWVTDGTPEGTHLVADLMAGPRASSPRDFAVFGDELFFNAGRPREGYELWKLPLAALEP